MDTVQCERSCASQEVGALKSKLGIYYGVSNTVQSVSQFFGISKNVKQKKMNNDLKEQHSRLLNFPMLSDTYNVLISFSICYKVAAGHIMALQ